MTETTDIAVVGAGAAGLAFAWAAAASGLSVTVLERGGAVDQREAANQRADWELALLGPFNANPNIRRGEADHPVDDSETPIKPAFFNALGGSTIRWGAHFPRMRPSDFAMRTLDGVGRDWPLSYLDLEPWYDLNDTMMGVSGLAGDPGNPARTPRETPPLPLCSGTERLAAGFNALGWHWWPCDGAILSTARGSREGCNNCGPCGVGCPRHARASADIAYLSEASARGVHLVTGATVTGLEARGGSVTAIRYVGSGGAEHSLSAAEVVLAGNGLGTTRLLATVPGLDNPLIGRGLMLHPTAIVTGRFDDPLQSWQGAFGSSLVSQEFYETDPARGFVRGFQMQALREQGPLITAHGGYGTRLPWGRRHSPAFERAFGHSISLTVTCDDLPEDDNRIALDPDRTDRWGMPIPRMIYRVGENTRKMKDFGIARAREALQAAGATEVVVTELSRNAGFHLLGTARMGTDAQDSVTDREGRVHGTENLSVVDGSVFATAGAVNPTSTVQAFALHAADALTHRLGLGRKAVA